MTELSARTNQSVTITELNIYPIKGLKGITVPSSELTPKGLAFDRQWMLINPKNQFVTQRQLARLSLIETELKEQHLRLSINDEQIEFSIDSFIDNPLQARIWKNDCEVYEVDEKVGDWLSRMISSPYPLRLVKMAEGFTRNVDQTSKFGENHRPITTDFADGFPFLVANKASLDEINRQLGSSFLMNRFRPNIVIEGIEPFVEHQLDRITHNDYQLRCMYPCERCVVTTIDQANAEKQPESQPLTVLKSLNPMPNNQHAAAFGENTVLEAGEGKMISVGDQLNVTFKEEA